MFVCILSADKPVATLTSNADKNWDIVRLSIKPIPAERLAAERLVAERVWK